MSELLDKLTTYGGIDVEDGKRRMMGNEGLYVRCLKMFYDQAGKSRLTELVGSGDYEEATKDAHALKGTTGNLSLTGLFEKYNEILRRLRAAEYDGLAALVEAAVAQQKDICDIIQSCM